VAVDQEALTASAPAEEAGSGDVAPPVRRRGVLGSRRRQVVAALVILAALGFLAAEGLSNATIYFKTADQAVADRAQLGTRQFRIEGTVGQQISQVGQTVRFTITANGVTVPIVDTGSPPQLFKTGIPVVLEGHWQGGYYASDQIMVKHTASYVEAHPNRVKPQPTPGAGLPGGPRK
jgi:cytochrome c-type biogenesis protein CcmE